jgi:hypothetical protein
MTNECTAELCLLPTIRFKDPNGNPTCVVNFDIKCPYFSDNVCTQLPDMKLKQRKGKFPSFLPRSKCPVWQENLLVVPIEKLDDYFPDEVEGEY